MKSVFLGGSRSITRLPPALEERLGNIVAHELAVILGDASGADKAMQAFFHALPYRDVTIFHAGHTPRHNLGHWPAHAVPAPRASSAFQFYAEKDRAMARAADYGLMLWDGKSPGTALNILRLTRAGKPAILMNMANRSTITFKSAQDWQNFLADQNASLRAALAERMTADENIPEPPQTRERHASEPAAALPLLP